MPESSVQTEYRLESREHGDAVVVHFGACRILDDRAVNAIGLELYGVADRDDVRRLILGKTLMLRSDMASKGGSLILCGLMPELKRLLAITKLDWILDIENTAEDALKA